MKIYEPFYVFIISTGEKIGMEKIVSSIIILVIYIIMLIIELAVPIIFFVFYLYDFIEPLLLKMGHFIGQKFPKIKNKKIIELWKKIQPQYQCMRYETPLIVYCFSSMPLCFIAMIIQIENEALSLCIAAILYISVYFFGMIIKYRNKHDILKEVLNNNENFLKLSFLPFTFLITVVGFCFTITGSSIFEIWDWFSNNLIDIIDWIKNKIYLLNDTSAINALLYMICISILFYFMSLPIQVISYFGIMVIKYFLEYGKTYKTLVKNIVSLIRSLF